LRWRKHPLAANVERVSVVQRNQEDQMSEQIQVPENSPASGRRWWWWALGGLMAGAASALLVLQLVTGRPFGPPRYNGTVLEPPRPVPDVPLTAHTGRPVSLHDLRGRVLLIYFGYTSCPDACPATMIELAAAVEELRPEQRAEVQVILMSVDPKRDTPARLGDYVTHFSPSFLGMTGSEEELKAVAAPFGVYFEQGERLGSDGYLVDHTASVFAVDKEGRLRLIYSFATPSEEIVADLRYLVRE